MKWPDAAGQVRTEPLKRGGVGHRAAVGGDHTQPVGLGGKRPSCPCLCTPACHAVSARRIRPSTPSAGEAGPRGRGRLPSACAWTVTPKGTRPPALRRLPRGPIIGACSRSPWWVRERRGKLRRSAAGARGRPVHRSVRGLARKPLADEADPAHPGHGAAPYRADQAARRLVGGSRRRLLGPASPAPDGFRPGQKRDAGGGGGRMAAARRTNARRMGG